MDLEDDLNPPPCPPYSRRYGPFTFDSGSLSRTEGRGPDQRDCSYVAQEIPRFDMEVGEDIGVNKKNCLKAYLDKITKEELTLQFFTDLVALSESATYLASLGTNAFVEWSKFLEKGV